MDIKFSKVEIDFAILVSKNKILCVFIKFEYKIEIITEKIVSFVPYTYFFSRKTDRITIKTILQKLGMGKVEIGRKIQILLLVLI